ncbi:MAG: hypothetical protein LCH74_01665 [Proteobacteria bacterium]|nr:hypothetical protein [Pseudomonadota bacterium]
MTRKPLLALLMSLFLLPASCALGVVAGDMQRVRLGRAPGEGGPLWVENLLWIGALALILYWARQIGRVYRKPAAEPVQKETII